MPANPLLLKSLLDEIDTLTDGLIGGQISAVDWHNAVARELFAHSIAEYSAAARKDERDILAQVKRIVGPQITALNDFTNQIERGEYEGRIDALKARAALYAGGIKQAFWGGKTDGMQLPCLPGGCEQCWSNCRCSLDIREDGVYWNCAMDDTSCSACVRRGNTWKPYKA